jgi:phosphoglucosamine mutase
MIRYPQLTKNIPRTARGPLPATLLAAVDEVNLGLGDEARVLVRPSGTEPFVRVLAEAATQAEAENLCAKVAALVTQELG